MKYVVDTSLINKLVDGIVMADELPSDGAFVVTHIQRDEIERTSDPKRRSDLLNKFSETISDVVPTSAFVLDVSRLDCAEPSGGITYSAIKGQLDAMNKQMWMASTKCAYSANSRSDRYWPISRAILI